jgi:hypothetical protein
MAKPKIMKAYDVAKDLKQQIKTLEKLLDAELGTIKQYMGEATVLLAPHGGEVVTYKQSKSRLILNQESLKEAHPRIYMRFCEEREGSRVLLLK